MIYINSAMPLEKPKKIPTKPGIYVFARGSKPLYVGKALNIKKRVTSYFRKGDGLAAKIRLMLAEATSLKFIETFSEIEALLKETELIKRHRPKYNILMRDDKNYFYVGITKEEFPRVFVTHQPLKAELLRITNKTELRIATRAHIRNSKKLVIRRGASYIGPFTSGGALHTTLKLLRRVFPYCTCKGTHKRPCLNSQIGRCVGYCCSQTQSSPASPRRSRGRAKLKAQSYSLKLKDGRMAYRKNIGGVIAVLTGKKTRLIAQLKKQLKEATKAEHYEEAARVRDQIFGLEDIFNHRFTLERPWRKTVDRAGWPELESRLKKLLGSENNIERIEGYDISNIGGSEATGSMVVFSRGEPDKSQYRKFRIKTVQGISDVDMIKEVLERRFRHPEWAFPQLIVIDGGMGQLSAALAALHKSEIRNPKFETPIVTALAKREEILLTERRQAIHLKNGDPALLHLFQQIRDEAHRFARAYHHRLRQKTFSNKKGT